MKFKRLFSFSIVFILALAGSLGQPKAVWAGSGWLPVGSNGFSAGQGGWTSLALDKNNVPYVAYEDSANGGKVTVMKYNGAAWETVGSAGFSAPATNVNLVLDSNNTPYIAYSDTSNYQQLTVMKYNGAAWELVGAPSTPHGAYDVSLALDSSNTPYVAFANWGGFYYANVIKYTGSAWVSVGSVDFTSPYSSTYLSLKLDKNNTPYLAYRDGSENNHGLYATTVKKFNGTTWVTVGTAYFSGGDTLYNSLAFDSQNTPFVAYEDDNNNNKAAVMKFNGTAWVPVGSAISATGGASWTSLALDKNDTPYLAYQENLTPVINAKATVRKFNGTDWETVGPAGFSLGAADYESLALDSNGIPYVAYFGDWGSGIIKATLMKYYTVLPPATFSKIGPSNAATDVNPNPTLSWGASSDATRYEYCIDTINNNLCDTSWLNNEIKTSVIPSGLKAHTTYFWQVRAVNAGGATYADATWETFTTGNFKVFLPALKR